MSLATLTVDSSVMGDMAAENQRSPFWVFTRYSMCTVRRVLRAFLTAARKGATVSPGIASDSCFSNGPAREVLEHVWVFRVNRRISSLLVYQRDDIIHGTDERSQVLPPSA